MKTLSLSRRLRRTHVSEGLEAASIKAYSIYNRMLLPTRFKSLEEDCRHLKEAVQVWDVASQRQVEIKGPDAADLMQRLTPRDLHGMKVGRCYYIPVVDENGGMLNDPVALKLSEDRFWLSLADSDLLLWVKGIVLGMGLKVDVFEPDVSPLSIQGPRAEELVSRVFGDAIRELTFFGFEYFPFASGRFLIARSGWSKQGGFEIYVEGSDYGMPLWDALFEAGSGLDVRPGGPNLIERVESGLLSYGNDMTLDNTPFECGLDRFCHPDKVINCIGREALLHEMEAGPKRKICPVEIDGDIPVCDRAWSIHSDGELVGQVTSAAKSPDFGTNVAIAMLDRGYWEAGRELRVETSTGILTGRVVEKFWN